MKIKIRPYKEGKKGLVRFFYGYECFNQIVVEDSFTLDHEQIREIYCKVLGVPCSDETIDQELSKVDMNSQPSVDMPEDILKCEKVLKLRQNAKANRTTKEWFQLLLKYIHRMKEKEREYFDDLCEFNGKITLLEEELAQSERENKWLRVQCTVMDAEKLKLAAELIRSRLS